MGAKNSKTTFKFVKCFSQKTVGFFPGTVCIVLYNFRSKFRLCTQISFLFLWSVLTI